MIFFTWIIFVLIQIFRVNLLHVLVVQHLQVLLHSAVFNALTSIIFSRRMDYKDVRIEKAVARYKENLELFSDSKFPNFFPFQKFLMGDFFDVKFLRINMAEIHQKIINPVFEEHKEEYNDEQVTDFLDVYLREMKAHKNVEKTTIEGQDTVSSF